MNEQNFLELEKVTPCRGMTDLFFSLEIPEIKQAIAICGTCPFIIQCKDYAVKNKIEHGVWGGESRSRISNIRRRSGGKIAVQEVVLVDTNSVDDSN